jgi:hypothetical protein
MIGEYQNECYRNKVGIRGLNVSGSGLGPMESSCEHDDELLGSINDGKFLDLLSYF